MTATRVTGPGAPAGRAAAELDTRPDEGTWTLREVVHHVRGVTAYADMMGQLA